VSNGIDFVAGLYTEVGVVIGLESNFSHFDSQ
jgi:hypothetical protein